jgi:hypothetical protein
MKNSIMITAILLILTPACAHRQGPKLKEIFHFDTSGWSHDIALDGKNLYVADREGGYLTFDTSLGFKKPGIFKPVRDVISLSPNSGMPVLASRFEGFVLVSATGQIRGSYSNGDIANAVEVRGDLAYAAYGMTGLVVMRLDQGQVRLVSRCPSSGWSHDLRLSGNQAFLADWKGLKVVDIRNAEKPSEVAFLPSPAQCISLSIKDSGTTRMLAIAEGHAGISVILLDSEGHPSFLGRNYLGLNPADPSHPESGGWVHSVAWADRYLFAANWKKGLTVLDVLDPKQPREIMQYSTGGTALGVKTQRQADNSYLVFLADGETGLHVFRFKP